MIPLDNKAITITQRYRQIKRLCMKFFVEAFFNAVGFNYLALERLI